MNVDDNPNTPAKYGVRGIPNLILFKGGDGDRSRSSAPCRRLSS